MSKYTKKNTDKTITENDIQYIKDNHGKLTRAEIGQVLGRSKASIQDIIKRYNIERKVDGKKTSYNMIYRSYKTAAKARGYVFNLTKEQFIFISSMDCFYCGSEPKATNPANIPSSLYSDNVKKTGTVYVNGIDRFDNNKGYTKDNIVPCCIMCNRMKLNHSFSEWIEHISKIFSYIKRSEI